MSQIRSNPAGSQKTVKQPLNVYTMMLILSLIFLITGTVCMAVELSRWGAPLNWWSTAEATSAAGS